MADTVYEDYIPNLIDSMLLNLGVSDSNFLLIKHYNTFNLSSEDISSLAKTRTRACFLYHSFNAGDMQGVYEPFLDWIKQLYYELSDESIDEFLDKSEVYLLHRPIFKSYFETGVCERKEELLISEVEYEQKYFKEEIVRMLQRLSEKRPMVLVLNKLHAAGSSTIRLVEELISNQNSRSIAVLATYNELAPEHKYIKDVWKSLLAKFDDHDCIIDWTFNSATLETEMNSVFKFNNHNLSEYCIKLNNMYHLLAFEQADFYLEIFYHKFEVEKVYIVPQYKFIFLELYARIAMCQDRTSDALLYCNGMRAIVEDNDRADWKFKYYYLAAQIHMYSYQPDAAEPYAQKCVEVCRELEDPFLQFKTEILQHMIYFQGWRNIWILLEDKVVNNALIEKAKKYQYDNHIAHIYIYSFDNNKKKYMDLSRIEEALPDFNRGIEIATRLGNDQLIIEGYKKNIMIASTNGYYDVANYFYGKCYEVATRNRDFFEEACIYNGMGYNCCTMEQYTKANEYFNKALLIYAKLDNIEYINETIYNMAVNAILAEDYAVADSYLDLCLKIVKIMKSNSVRVCNISKIYGLKAYCCYELKVLYRCKINLQHAEQFLGHVIELEDRDLYEIHLWDDDLFLYYFVGGLLLEYENKLEDARARIKKAEKYLDRSSGSEFFNRTPYSVSYARICRKLGYYEEADNILKKCMEFCETKGYLYKKNLVKAELEGRTYTSVKWNLSFKGISLEEIVEMSVRKGIMRDYQEQKEEINFLSIWQKFINNTHSSIKQTIHNAMTTLKNNYSIDEMIFIRMENGKPVVRYNDSSYDINEDKIDYLVEYFNRNRSEFAINRLDKGYTEHKDMISRVFGFNAINTLICAPVFVNEQLNSLFIASVLIDSDWNYKSKRYEFDENDLSILMMLYRQLLDAIESMEAQQKIENINSELQFVNKRLKEMAVRDTLTGLYNRQGLSEELELQVKRASDVGEKLKISFLYMDLDNFKYYNDTFGHDIGDLILREFSTLIKDICGTDGEAVRYGGDEFIILLYSDDRQKAEQVAKDVYSALKRQNGFAKQISETLGVPVEIPKDKNVSCSIGISKTVISPDDVSKNKIEDALKRADEVMYYVKKTTKHRYVFYDDIKDETKQDS